MDKEMVMEFRFGQMERSTRGSGQIINTTERENYGLQMEIYMRESGRIISLMALVFTFIMMDQGMKDIGKTTSKMDKELKLKIMEVSMMENTRKA